MKKNIFICFLLLNNCLFGQEKLLINPIHIGIDKPFTSNLLSHKAETIDNYTTAFSKLYDSLSVKYQVKYYANFQNKTAQNIDLSIVGDISEDNFGKQFLDLRLMNTKKNTLITYATMSNKNLISKSKQEIIKEYAWQVDNWLSTFTIPTNTPLHQKKLLKPHYKIAIKNYFTSTTQNAQIAKNITHIANNFLVSKQQNPDRDSIITWTSYEYAPAYRLGDSDTSKYDLVIKGSLMEMDNRLLLNISFEAEKSLYLFNENGNKIQQFFILDKAKILNNDYTELIFSLTNALYSLISLNFNKRDLMNLRHIEVSPPPTKP